MDSLTQFALGAGIGVAVLGRRIGARRAAVAGGLLGTLPDLDSFVAAADPVERFVSHRGATHSLAVHLAATPVLGEALRRAFPGLRDARGAAWLAVALVLTTHALLDGLTIYGTRLLWPFVPDALGLGSLFIIDPLYTVPLLVVTLWALAVARVAPRLRAATLAALALSTAYAGWSVAAQQLAAARGEAYLRARGVTPELVVATPTPFNTTFWRVIAIDGARYHNVYVPLLGGDDAVRAYRHRRSAPELEGWLGEALARDGPVRTLAGFTDGFYRAVLDGDAVELADLRMGLPPRYAFRFEVARRGGERFEDVVPRRIGDSGVLPGDLRWLGAGIVGRARDRPAERSIAEPWP